MSSKELEIVVNVEEARIGQVKAGQTVTISVPAFPGKLFPAKVASIAPSADTRTHTFPVKVRPPGFVCTPAKSMPRSASSCRCACGKSSPTTPTSRGRVKKLAA